MDALRMLTEQHDRIDLLFARLAAAEGATKRRLFLEVADLLAMHSILEERHFYPLVRDRRTSRLVTESLAEHREVKRLLSELLGVDFDVDVENGSFDEKIEALRAALQEHVAEEEGELFPRAERLLSADDLEELGQEMAATMVELADSEPRNDIPLDLSQSAPSP